MGKAKNKVNESIVFNYIERKRAKLIKAFELSNLTATEMDKLDDVIHQLENLQNPY